MQGAEGAHVGPDKLSKSKKIPFYGLMTIITLAICFGALEIVLTAFFSGGETPAQRLFIPRDGHLTDAGHRLVARSLYDFVMDQTDSH